MKKTFQIISVCLAMIAGILVSHAQAVQDLPDAKTVIEKHIKALGPIEELKKAKAMSIVATMSMETPNGPMKADMKMFQKEGKATTTINIDQFGEVRQGSDGKVFWTMNPFSGPQLLKKEDLGIEAEEMADVIPALKWLENVGKIKVTGMEDVDGKPAYALEFSKESTRFFDKESGLITKIKTVNKQMGGAEVEMFPSDYKKVGAIMLAHKQVTATPQGDMTVTVEKIEVNPEIDDAKFALPDEIKKLLTDKSK